MTNLFTEMNKEVAEHFTDKKEQKQEEVKEDPFAGFKRYYVGGQEVIDLTSVDEDWSAYELYDRGADIERKQLYGDQAGSTKF